MPPRSLVMAAAVDEEIQMNSRFTVSILIWPPLTAYSSNWEERQPPSRLSVCIHCVHISEEI